MITYPFPLGRATGGARMTREIGRWLGERGAEVVLVPVSRPAPPGLGIVDGDEWLGTAFDAELAESGVSVSRVTASRWSQWLDGLNVRRAVAGLLQEGPADAVLGYFHEAAFLPSLLKRRRVPFGYISTWPSYALALEQPRRGGARSRLLKPLRNRSLIIGPHRRAQVLFATSRFTRDELIQELGVDPARIVVCHLGVDRHFAELPRAAPTRPTRILFIGQIKRLKGVSDAIQALAELASSGLRDWEFRIMGQGDHAWARDLAQAHHIGHQVTVGGPLDDRGLCAELQRAHLAVLPSYTESFGLAFAEAQAAGLAVVAYRTGSVPEVVEDGVTGWLAPVCVVSELARCLAEALRSPDEAQRRGLAGRARVRSLFSWPRVADTMLSGLDRLAPRQA